MAPVICICICITTKFSGSMQSALNARTLLQEKYPQVEITVIDATINTVLQGQYVLEAARLRDHGVSYQNTVARLEEIKSTGRIFFTVGNMEYLKHGGRIGKIAALAGSVLDINCYSIAVGYGYDKEEGIAFRDQALSTLQSNGYDINEIPIYQIGATIGVHTGLYPLGFGIIEKGIFND